jgi:glucose/arabinose dehydrogenase
MFSRRAVLGGVAGGAAFTLLADRADAAPAVGQTLAEGLVIPWGLAFLPSGDALVTERESGAVHEVSRTGGRQLVGTIACDGAAEGEGGLLGAALSPSFAQDGQVFFYRTFSGTNQVVRATYQGGSLGPPTVILTGIPAGRIHNGGRIKFGPDGKLYVATGESGDPDLSQLRGSMGGKILRINRDGSAPASNPFDGGANRRRVWTWGHRNVQGLAWDGRGRMFATELGSSIRDELNHIVKGHNYGWPHAEGGDGRGGYHDPFVTWSNEECSPSGLAILRNRAWVGALRGQALWSVDLGGPTARRKTRYFHQELGRIRTVERAPDGSLWVTTSNRTSSSPAPTDDRVVRIVF